MLAALSRLAASRSTSSAVVTLRDHLAEGRAPLRQRARLVDDQGVDRAQAFDRLRVTKQNASLSRAAGGDHDRHRCRKPKRTRTRDDEHRHGVDAQHTSRTDPDRTRPQTKNVASEIASTASTNQKLTLSASRCIGARERCAWATSCTICARTVSRADLVGAHDRGCRTHSAWRRSLCRPESSRPGSARRSASIRRHSIGPRSPRHPPAPSRPGARAVGRRRAHASAGCPLRCRPRCRRRAVFGARREQRLDCGGGARTCRQLKHLSEQRQRHDDRRGLEVDADTRPCSRNESGNTSGATVATTL